MWTVILEDENGEAISVSERRLLMDSPDSLKNIPLRLIKYLDPFGDTIFNYLQMDDLILDLEALRGNIPNETIDIIIQLALKCKSGQHLYVVFYGD